MRVLFFILISLALSAAPLSTTIFHPAQMGSFTPIPQSLQIKKETIATLSETNDYEKERYYYLDYELSALLLSQEIPLTHSTSCTLLLPLYHFWGGFMDNPLDAFHNATGTLHGYRHNQEGKKKIRIDYLSLHKRGPFTALGDVEIYYKRVVGSFGYLLGLKLPSHSKKESFAPRKLAYMVGLIYQHHNLTFNFHISYNPKKRFPLASTKRIRSFLSASYQWRRWLFEYRFASSVFRSKAAQFDSIANTINVAYRIGSYRFFISENLAPFYNTPDLSIGVEYTF